MQEICKNLVQYIETNETLLQSSNKNKSKKYKANKNLGKI